LFWKTKEGTMGDDVLYSQMGKRMNNNTPPMINVVSTSVEFQGLLLNLTERESTNYILQIEVQ
jgi:hypothetical protein